MGEAADFAVGVGFAQEQRGEACDEALEGDVFELLFGFDDAAAEGFEDAEGDARLGN